MSTQSLRFTPEESTSQNVRLLNASSSRYEGGMDMANFSLRMKYIQFPRMI